MKNPVTSSIRSENNLPQFVSGILLASAMLTGACSDYGAGAATGGAAATTGGTVSSGGQKATGGTTTATGGSTSTGGTTGGTTATTGGVPSTGGQAATGGATTATGGSGAGAAACTNVTPCGGDAVGTWTATSSCLKVSGQLDLTLLGLGCTAATVTGSRQVSGTFTVKADGSFSDNTMMTGSEQLMMPASCLFISGTTTTCDRVSGPLQGSFGYTMANCVDASGGGCTCTATIQQTGGMGVPAGSPSTTGQYTISGNELTATGSPNDVKYSYCVAASTLTVTPKDATTTGTIVLQKQ